MILYHRCLKNNQCFSNLFVSSWFIEISLLYETIDADSVFEMYSTVDIWVGNFILDKHVVTKRTKGTTWKLSCIDIQIY